MSDESSRFAVQKVVQIVVDKLNTVLREHLLSSSAALPPTLVDAEDTIAAFKRSLDIAEDSTNIWPPADRALMTQDGVFRRLRVLAERSRHLPRNRQELQKLTFDWEDALRVLKSGTPTILWHNFEEFRQKVLTGPPGVDKGEGPEDACPAPAQEAAAPQTIRGRTTTPVPRKNAVLAYRVYITIGDQNQIATARILSERWGKSVNQGAVSRWVRRVEEWMKAGNVLPSLDTERPPRPQMIAVDPARLDVGSPRPRRRTRLKNPR